MPDRPLHRLERRFFKNRGMQRPPARILAMRDQPVSRAKHPAMCFASGKYGIGWYYHGITPHVEVRPSFGGFIVHQGRAFASQHFLIEE
jgi:hypothetical protein